MLAWSTWMNLRNASTHSSSIETSQNDILLVCLMVICQVVALYLQRWTPI
jgi:hypothetical protein